MNRTAELAATGLFQRLPESICMSSEKADVLVESRNPHLAFLRAPLLISPLLIVTAAAQFDSRIR
jgi:hypothetical protein